MAKYQLVFVKLRAAAQRIVQITRNYELLKKHKSFTIYRENVSKIKECEQNKAKTILDTIKSALKNMVRIRDSKRKIILSKYALKWKENVQRIRIYKEMNKKITQTEEKLKKELSAKEKSISALEQKLQQHVNEAVTLKENEKNLKQTIKEKEEKEKILKEMFEKVKRNKDTDDNKRMPKSVEERLQILENHVSNLENENKELKERLESTDSNVGGFIQEISEILDSNDFISILKKWVI